MYLCYIDESGTPDLPGNTSHFVLAGLSVPIWHWKDCDREISAVKKRYDLGDSEIHTAWIARKYFEQSKIINFHKLPRHKRISEVETYRKSELLKLQRPGNSKKYRQVRKNYIKTSPYIHLTYDERRELLVDLCKCVGNWGFARLFAECIDKIHYNPALTKKTAEEQAFEQVISRFEQYLESIGKGQEHQSFGLIIHDNNETVSKKHTSLMKHFHKKGTLWTDVNNIIETPLFVDSELTSMVQIADLCSYALRRYLENNEDDLFKLIFVRADRKHGAAVGVRHFTTNICTCEICSSHSRY